MEQETAVPRQAILLAVFATAAAVAVGHRCGLANVIVLSVGVVLWLGLAAAYHLRARGHRDQQRTALDRRAAWCALVGFGVPGAVSVALWQMPRFDDGLVLSSGAAAFAAVLVTAFFAAILASSMVDWYYVLPKVLGITGAPIWLTNEEALGDPRGDLGKDRRRGIAQVWVFHRGVCELLTLTAVALLLAIVLVAAGNALSADKTLPAAIESLGGSGIAFGVLQYLGPRLRGGLDFMLASPIGLGMWVSGRDDDGEPISGFVVDVSIAPGVKLVDESDRHAFIPLAQSHKVSPAGRPAGVTSRDCHAIVQRHLARDPHRIAEPWWRRRRRRETPQHGRDPAEAAWEHA